MLSMASMLFILDRVGPETEKSGRRQRKAGAGDRDRGRDRGNVDSPPSYETEEKY